MMTRPPNRRRGSWTLSLAAILVVTAAFCGIALQRSVEAYRSSADLAHRLEMLAAAEGAAVSLSVREADEIRVGRCTIRPEALAEGVRPVLVSLRLGGGAPIQRHFIIHYERRGDTWHPTHVVQ